MLKYVTRDDFVKYMEVHDFLEARAKSVAKAFEKVSFGPHVGWGFDYEEFYIHDGKVVIQFERFDRYEASPDHEYLSFSVDQFLDRSETDLITDGMAEIEENIQKQKDLDKANEERKAAHILQQELNQLAALKAKYEKKD
jgi:hypothetical protein